MLKLATSLLLISSASACISEFQTLNACLDDVTECADCRVVGPMAGIFSDGFCDTANDSLCNAFNCCPACEQEFESYETCFADLVAKIPFGSCEIDCERAPTPAPTPTPAPSTLAEAETLLDEELESQGCMQHFIDFTQCAAQNPLQCGGCLLTNIPGDPLEIGFCTAANDAICGFGTCCEPCAAEFTKFDACFEVIVQDITFGNCEIDCDDFEAKEPLDAQCFNKVQNYTTCLAENPLECGTCAVLNLPSDPNENGFCEVATDSICGFSKCCSSCDDQFQEFDECFEDWVSTVTLGQCEMDCDTYEGGATGGGATDGCVDKLQTYTDCVISNPFECAMCVINNLPNPGDGDFCQAAADSVCGIGDCCSSCSAEFDDFDECFESFASTVTMGDCQIDCDNTTPKTYFGARALRGNTDA